jgi:hypothetical protein
MNLHNKSSYRALADPDQDDDGKCYAAYLKTKSRIPFEKWAKLQKCNYCGYSEHVRPQCKHFHADKAGGKLPSLDNKCLKPALNKDGCRNKFSKDPKLKAHLSAFAAFTTNYITETVQEVDNGTDHKDDGDTDNANNNNDDIHAFMGMFGSLKE